MEKKVKERQLQNLIPFNELTENERRALASKAGKASVKKRRENKKFREELALALNELERNPRTGEKKSRKAIGMMMLAMKVMKGDLKAIELAAKLAGEFTEKHELTGADGQPIQLQAMPPKKLTKAEMKVALEELREDL